MIISQLNDEIIERIYFKNRNFAFPLQARKWLSQLENDQVSGIRIKKNLSLEPDVMGFSFASNALGLRGPCDASSPTVFFGTSYAMGFSVDNGQNWYDGLNFADGALNLGLPVGVQEHANLLAKYHTGPRGTAILLYHPNIWAHIASYRAWRSSNKPAFEHFRWETGLATAMTRAARTVANVAAGNLGSSIVAELDDRIFLLNSTYARFDPALVDSVYREAAILLLGILRSFDRTYVFRVPTKEDFASRLLDNEALRAQRANHQEGWAFFRTLVISELGNCEIDEGDSFSLADYHSCDTHWNAHGNATMQAVIRSKRGLESLLAPKTSFSSFFRRGSRD